MARPKKLRSREIDLAEERITGMEVIDPRLVLGDDLTLEIYRAQRKKAKDALEAYNRLLSQVDGLLNTYQIEEELLGELNVRMLAGVGSRFGFNSSEYEQAGGTRISERKRPKNGNGEDESEGDIKEE